MLILIVIVVYLLDTSISAPPMFAPVVMG